MTVEHIDNVIGLVPAVVFAGSNVIGLVLAVVLVGYLVFALRFPDSSMSTRTSEAWAG